MEIWGTDKNPKYLKIIKNHSMYIVCINAFLSY